MMECTMFEFEFEVVFEVEFNPVHRIARPIVLGDWEEVWKARLFSNEGIVEEGENSDDGSDE